ncbi:invertase [Campylobacterota bacterium]|nr:invertase [Campylobacterota bacterium]
MIYGYIRVSTDKQDCANQKLGIEEKAKSLGIAIEKYIEDSGVSGIIDPTRRALGGILKKLQRGDILICSELSRLGRKLFMIMRILEHCMDCGAKVYAIKEGYELGDNIQSKVLAFAFGLAAEIERDLISARTKESLARIKASGRKLGRELGSKNREHKLDKHKERIRRLLLSGVAKAQIARRLKVSPPTLYDFIATNLTTL